MSLIKDLLERPFDQAITSKYTAMNGLIYLGTGTLVLIWPGISLSLTVIWWRPDEERLDSVQRGPARPFARIGRQLPGRGNGAPVGIRTGVSVDTRSPNWRQTHDQGYSCQPVLRDIARWRFQLRLIGCGNIRCTHRGDRLCLPGNGRWRWLADYLWPSPASRSSRTRRVRGRRV